MAANQEAGDPCTDGNECLSGVCASGVCAGLSNGDRCVVGGCAAGYFCNLNAANGAACQATAPSLSTCNALSQCGAGNICNMAASPPVCLPLFSAKVGTKVNTPDLCTSGFTDANNLCVNPVATSVLGSECQCGTQPAAYPGTNCYCANDNLCRLRQHTLRTVNMVNARKAARACFQKAKAPNGLPCA